MENWIKTAASSLNLYSEKPFKAFKAIEPIKPPAWEESRKRMLEKQQKASLKLQEQQQEEAKRPMRNLLAEMYARDYGADYKLLYSDPGKAADMIVRNLVYPVNKALLPNPEVEAFTPPMPK